MKKLSSHSQKPQSLACKQTKIGIIGAGSVGATAAYSLMLAEDIEKIVIFDRDEKKAIGVALDLMHASPFTSGIHVTGTSTAEELAGADIFIISAGKRQKEGETRLDLVKANKAVFDELIPLLKKASPEAIFIIVSNPVDVLSHYAIKNFGLSPERVFGTGTMLDTARFRQHLADKLAISPRSIHAYIMGEHGDSSFPVVSIATIAGVHLTKFPGVTKNIIDECYQDARTAAYRIINDVGFTCYSIAMVLKTLVKAIIHDSREVFMLSTELSNYHGIDNVSLSVPCVVGREGIQQIITLPLSDDEVHCLHKSAELLKSFDH